MTIIKTTRRELMQLLAVGGAAALAAGLPGASAFAQARKDVLVLGIDVSDVLTYDPAQQSGYTPPVVMDAIYDMLVTMSPGDYVNVKPSLATEWTRTEDGNGWRLTIRKGVKFNSGNPLTVQDVKWSLDRVLNLKAPPAVYINNIAAVNIVDDDHVDIVLKNNKRPILDILCHPAFSIYDSKVLSQHGGDASPDAKTLDKAMAWLDQNSCGTGPYTLVAWERNNVVQLQKNPNYWRGEVPFERVILRIITDPAAQLLAVQRGEIDAAFNLVPEQIATLKDSPDVRVQSLNSLDFVYMTLTADPTFNKALAVREVRQAVSHAIDYDGIINGLLGGHALRPASFLPIGVSGSTPEVAEQVRPAQDLDKAKELLKQGGYPDGFEFKLTYGNGLIAGVSFDVLAQKIQSDLARVGIKAQLEALDPVTMRTQFFQAKTTSVLIFWAPSGVDNNLWAAATVERVATRVQWKAPDDLVKLVNDATDEQDKDKQAQLWVEYQKRMVEQANLIVLFQPIYQIAVSNRLSEFPLTAASWQLEIRDVKVKS